MNLLFLKKTGYIPIACSMLFACSVGHKYTQPDNLTPSHWVAGKNETQAQTHAWWRQYNDPILNSLLEQQINANLNLRSARERLKKAQKEYLVATSYFWPKVGAHAYPPQGTGARINQLVGINTVIEADLFGRLQQTRLRAKAYVEAENNSQQFTLLNIQTEIANSYIELRETQQRKRILHASQARSRQLLDVINSRYRNGFCDYVDVVQQKSLISVLQSDAELTDGFIKILVHKLEILTGNLPGALNKTLSTFTPIPTSKQKIDLGIPSSLLSHRPDIMAAEKLVAAAHANINIALASLFPQLSLGWLFAWQTRLISANLVSFSNPQSTFFGTFNAPLFDLGAYRNLDVYKQEKILLVIQYEMTVLNALHEVENQYTNYIHNKASAVYLKKAAQQKQLALKLTKEKYQKGLTSYDTLFRLQDDLNHIELSYVHTVSLREQARINLYHALGIYAPPKVKN